MISVRGVLEEQEETQGRVCDGKIVNIDS